MTTKSLTSGNMANDGFSVVRELQKQGIDCHLYVYAHSIAFGLPQWEVLSLTADEVGGVIRPDWEAMNKDYEKPPWIHFLHHRVGYRHIPQNCIDILKEMRKYDLIIAHIPFFIHAPFSGRPFLVFEAGTIRYFTRSPTFKTYSRFNQMRMRLMERGYHKCHRVLLTNPDTIDFAEDYGFNWSFMPFLIPTEIYKSMKVNPRPSEHVIMMPSRQNFAVKGNDRLIRAFAKFVNEQPDSLLILAEWGEDVDNAKRLIVKLDISEKVQWLNPVSKPLLIELYNKATVVADQFILGSYGTSSPEAMSCGRPVLCYLSPTHMEQTFGAMPPLINVRTEDEILDALHRCTDKGYRRKVGDESRRWMIDRHSPEAVIPIHLKRYREALSE